MSVRARDGTVLEMVLRRQAGETRLVTWRDGATTEATSVSIDGHRYVPYSPKNNLLTHRVVVLPSAASDYESEAELAGEVRRFIHRYVDVNPEFEEIAVHYVLLTWGYDVFNELPYLRVRGQYGCGKSRFLLTVGALCHKPIFASGASTVSPIFRLIDQIGGTLVVDEADFWASDERAEIIKILNNGNARGFPVLRSEVTPSKEFSPRAFHIYGPKLVATRHRFEDEALESRCLTEVMGRRPLRRDIPITLPGCFEEEAEVLRNKLLMYRFRRFGRPVDVVMEREPGLEPRRAQIVAPLISISPDAAGRDRIRAFIAQQGASDQDTSMETERRVLGAVKAVLVDPSAPLTMSAIARRFDADWGERYGVEAAPRWIGSILRRLGVRPQKSNGVYVIPASAYAQLRDLFVDYQLGDIGEHGDVEQDSRNTL